MTIAIHCHFWIFSSTGVYQPLASTGVHWRPLPSHCPSHCPTSGGTRAFSLKEKPLSSRLWRTAKDSREIFWRWNVLKTCLFSRGTRLDYNQCSERERNCSHKHARNLLSFQLSGGIRSCEANETGEPFIPANWNGH